MSWISENKSIWRAPILVLGIVAFIGPWGFDRINVPAEYPCSPPNVRLEGDFCGLPLDGFRILGWSALGLISSSAGMVTGAVVFSDWVRQILYSIPLLLLVLPLFGTLLLLLRGDSQQQSLFSIAAWGLGAGIALVIAIMNFLSLFRVVWLLWGLLLYIGLGICALILEVMELRRRVIKYQMSV